MRLSRIAILIALSLALTGYRTGSSSPSGKTVQTAFTIKRCEDTLRTYFLGIDATRLYIKEKQFGRRDRLQQLFAQMGLDKKAYKRFVKLTRDVPGYRDIRSKDKYYILSEQTAQGKHVRYFAYRISPAEYVVVDLSGDMRLALYEKPVTPVAEQYAFILQKSLYKTFKEKKIPADLIAKLDQAFQNKISMSKLRKGDTIRFAYDALYIDGEFYDYSDIRAASIHTAKKRYFVAEYLVGRDSSYEYVDESGNYFECLFLKSPVKQCKIVSRYNLKRFHPILQEVKAHLGTDFAAPHGAPIYATASGTVTAAAYTQNNGYFVKIKHDKVYETQYLHMSKFAKGIRKGTKVKQGQVIGYVGSTGLATGPHVCYRFWKKGVQVDPLKQKLSKTKKLNDSEMPAFQAYLASVRSLLDAISLN